MTAEATLFYLLAPVMAWVVIWVTAAPKANGRPAEDDWRGLETAHPFLRFSARHTRLAKFLAFITITACLWTAMSGMDWPVPVALMLVGTVFLVIGIAWTYHREFARRKR